MLYEAIICNKKLGPGADLESGLYCFLGSQGVGKTYTVTGEIGKVYENCGLLGYLMRDVF